MNRMDAIFYQCDPNLHLECEKTRCYTRGGSCRHTLHKEFRVAGTEGIPAKQMLGEALGSKKRRSNSHSKER